MGNSQQMTLFDMAESADTTKKTEPSYYDLAKFNSVEMSDGLKLNPKINIGNPLYYSAIENLIKYICCGDIYKAFAIPLYGVLKADDYEKSGGKKNWYNSKKAVETLLQGIKEESDTKTCCLSDNAIINACKITSFDVWVKNPVVATKVKTYENVNPDKDTVQNIYILVKRVYDFFKDMGGDILMTNEGEYYAGNTLWSVNARGYVTMNKDRVQSLVRHFDGMVKTSISKVGIFSPIENKGYFIRIDKFNEWNKEN